MSVKVQHKKRTVQAIEELRIDAETITLDVVPVVAKAPSLPKPAEIKPVSPKPISVPETIGQVGYWELVGLRPQGVGAVATVRIHFSSREAYRRVRHERNTVTDIRSLWIAGASATQGRTLSAVQDHVGITIETYIPRSVYALQCADYPVTGPVLLAIATGDASNIVHETK